MSDGAEASSALASLPVASADDDLDPDGEAKPKHVQNGEIHACDGRGSQFNLSYAAKEGRIGHPQQLFHHQGYQNRESYPPNGFEGITLR